MSEKGAVQKQAIHAYLQSLLLEEDAEDNGNSISELKNVDLSTTVALNKHEPEVKSEAKIKPDTVVLPTVSLPLAEPKEKTKTIGIEQLVAEIPEVITEVKVQEKVETQTIQKTETEVVVKSEESVELEAIDESGVPDWAEERFQCLLFDVAGLSLAVPLVKLNSVIPWDENITETPNKTNWYLGLVQHLKKQVKVIDTALLVMPENRHIKLEIDTKSRLSHILLVDDFKWGLACSSIGDVVWLNKDEVKWRKNKTSRIWLSGTSLKHLCALMDTEVFANMLTNTQ